jgi:hypothetical protein
VVTDDATDVVATLQLSFIPGLSRGARFGPRSRRSAFGPTTDRSRDDAGRFYERLASWPPMRACSSCRDADPRPTDLDRAS